MGVGEDIQQVVLSATLAATVAAHFFPVFWLINLDCGSNSTCSEQTLDERLWIKLHLFQTKMVDECDQNCSEQIPVPKV